MSDEKKFTLEEAKWVGEQVGADWKKYSIEEFRSGLEVELEHGKINPATNVTNNDLELTAKIALAHLNEFPDYYERLELMEIEAEKFWNKKNKYSADADTENNNSKVLIFSNDNL